MILVVGAIFAYMCYPCVTLEGAWVWISQVVGVEKSGVLITSRGKQFLTVAVGL